MAGLSHVAVAGPPPLSLIVAQMPFAVLEGRVFLGCCGLRRFSPGVGNDDRAGRDAARRRAAGFGSGCDGRDWARGGGDLRRQGVPVRRSRRSPPELPALPEMDCSMGDHGGSLVDAGCGPPRGVFAAGDCAELRLGSISLPSRLHSSSRVMGEVAGLNAAGAARSRPTSPVRWPWNCSGSRSARRGLTRRKAAGGPRYGQGGFRGRRRRRRARLRVDRLRPGPPRVHGVQVAGGALSLSEYISLAVASGATLEELAYHESPYLPSFNRDKSPISLTAGRALVHLERGWQLKHQGTRLRHGRRCRARPSQRLRGRLPAEDNS